MQKLPLNSVPQLIQVTVDSMDSISLLKYEKY